MALRTLSSTERKIIERLTSGSVDLTLNETFWVSAKVHEVGGHYHFEFKDVIHTRKPMPSQFDILLDQGEITMDHLLKRSANGRVSEKGPLFKINAASLPLQFPPSQTYALT